MNHLQKFVLYWGPPTLWMALIFSFSSYPSVEVSQKDIINFLFFKSLHVIEYAILYLLLFRAFYPIKTLSAKKKYLFPFLIALLYAISDEVHQTFVPTRNGTPQDVFIDFFGISIMYIYIKHYGKNKRLFSLLSYPKR